MYTYIHTHTHTHTCRQSAYAKYRTAAPHADSSHTNTHTYIYTYAYIHAYIYRHKYIQAIGIRKLLHSRSPR